MKINFDPPAPPSSEKSLELTERAALRIKKIMEKPENEGAKFLKVSVSGGGCGGYSYKFKLVTEHDPSDVVISNPQVAGVYMVVDLASLEYLQGSTVDYEETLEASQFVIHNPNAKTSCGCGNSFSL